MNQRFYLQPIYSRLRSEYVLACSIPAPVSSLGGFTNLTVVCAEFQPASLMKTPPRVSLRRGGFRGSRFCSTVIPVETSRRIF